MRPVHQLEIKVGLLVLAGLIGTSTLIMTADKFRIESTYVVTAYLKDAGGLRVDSPVTLSGIAVGKVAQIEFVPSGSPDAVKAAITIAQGVKLPADVEAHLATSGVFGDASLALAAPAKSSGSPLPADGTGVIRVQPGFLDRAADQANGILGAVDDLLDPKTRSEAKRLVTAAADLATHAAGVAKGLDEQQGKIAAILANLEAVTGELKATTVTLNQRLDPLLTKMDATFEKAGTLADHGALAIADLDGLVLAANGVLTENRERVAQLLTGAAGAASKAQRVLAALEGGQGVLGQLLLNRDLAKDLQTVSVDLAAAATQVADKPSRLVFDDSDGQRQADQAKRNREKMRRTLAEGLGQPAPVEQAKAP
jgi:ABC-type transporter Mla subunit MlaD